MSVIVHTADVHLDSPLAGLPDYEGVPRDDVRLATRRALTNVVDLALDEGADVMIIAGDLYDGDLRDANTALFLCAELSRLRRAGVEVLIAYGNHDAESVVTRRLPLPDGVAVMPTRRAGTVSFPQLRIAVHGQGYGRRDVMKDLSAAYPKPVEGLLNIGVLHTAATGRDGHAPYAPCSVEALAAHGYDYWALGHVHEFEVLCRDPWIVFPGCPQGRGLRECGAKGVVLIETDGDRVVSVESRAVDVVRWKRVDVDVAGTTDRDEALSRVRESLAASLTAADGRPLACRVTLAGACPADRSLGARPQQLADEVRALALDVGAGQLWIEGVRCATEPDGSTGDLAARRDPIARLLVDARAQAADPEGLRDRVPSLGDLMRMLPPGTLDAEHAGPDDAAWLGDRVAGAERLILGRLGAGTEEAA
jgi:DNA repair protein SbcD/Mre11